MELANWQTYAAPAIVLIVIGIFIWRAVKRSQANCCGGRCGCAVSKKKKKLRAKSVRS